MTLRDAFGQKNPHQLRQPGLNLLWSALPWWNWGFRKMKLDIFYGSRTDTLALARQCREAAAKLPGVVELEGHVPEPSIAQYFDVIRLNDVHISRDHPAWRSVVAGHYEVCAKSAPQHMLCLDHIGGNHAAVGPEDFAEHARIMGGQLDRGYPVVGLLPMSQGESVTEAVAALLLSAEERDAAERSRTR